MGQALRTPAERFAALPDWPYAPRWLDDLAGCDGLRVHYVDENPGGRAGVALCLHGNPTWGYLYRRMIPVFAAAGMRVVAPDLIGFGRSDKPDDPAAHRFGFHRAMLQAFVERLELRDVMLVCQDWGGLLGLTLPHAMPERFTRLLVMNTTLATGAAPTEGFLQWREYTNRAPDMAVCRMLQRGKPTMSDAQAAGYDAPFPDARYKAAIRAFANMVPITADAPGADVAREAAAYLAQRWTGESFMAIGEADPVLGTPVMEALRTTIRGCPPPMRLPEAGHFVPEWGERIAHAALAHFGLATGASR